MAPFAISTTNGIDPTQMRDRLATEVKITAERQAQAAASAAGRFEDLTALWKRVQSATIKAPMEREAEQLKNTREIKDHNARLVKIEQEQAQVLRSIDDTLGEILHKREPAVFGA